METIYQRPVDYDLEHEGDDQDIAFYLRLVDRLRPARVLEIGAGSGRVTIPLARHAADAAWPMEIVGLEAAVPMLDAANRKREQLPDEQRQRVSFVHGDLRVWDADRPVDLVIAPCSSLTHLLTLEDQIAAWSRAKSNLSPGGRFVADVTMPDLVVYAESLQTPPRTLLEVDVDSRDPTTGARLLRYKTTRYFPNEQRAEIRFLYDKFPEDAAAANRYVSDFASHVYYPRELELLFLLSGFQIDARFGDYRMRPVRPTSRQLILIGRA